MTTKPKRKRNKGLDIPLKAFLFLALFLFPAGNRTWAAPEIEVKLEPSHGLKAGQTAQLEIQVSWRTSEALYFFTLPQIPLENLSLEEMGESNETFQRDGEEWKRKVFRLHLKPEKPGKAQIRAFRLNYIDPTNQKGGFLDIPVRELKVRQDLSRFYPAAAAIAGMALFTGILAGWTWVRRRKPSIPTQPEEIGLEEHYLSLLHSPQMSLSEAGRLLRAYLSEKSAGGSEGKLSLKESKILEKIVGQLEELRFASRSSPAEEEKRLLEEIVRFIEEKRVIVHLPNQN